MTDLVAPLHLHLHLHCQVDGEIKLLFDRPSDQLAIQRGREMMHYQKNVWPKIDNEEVVVPFVCMSMHQHLLVVCNIRNMELRGAVVLLLLIGPMMDPMVPIHGLLIEQFIQ